MNLLEKKMVETLIELKLNHNVTGVKCEFESEGTRFEEALRLKEVATRAGLDLTIKIGGCEALRDIYDSKIIGAGSIVAPMIESPYAMKKYMQAVNRIFPDAEMYEVEFLINIETITGLNNIDSILNLPEAKSLAGIVLGRVDMAKSLNMTREDVNSEEIFKIANIIAEKVLKHNKKLLIGGGVSADSLPFFAKLPENSLHKFETRKIIFDAQKALTDKNTEKGILKALGFELMWLKNKRDFYGMIHNEDSKRLIMLESLYKKSEKEIGKVYV